MGADRGQSNAEVAGYIALSILVHCVLLWWVVVPGPSKPQSSKSVVIELVLPAPSAASQAPGVADQPVESSKPPHRHVLAPPHESPAQNENPVIARDMEDNKVAAIPGAAEPEQRRDDETPLALPTEGLSPDLPEGASDLQEAIVRAMKIGPSAVRERRLLMPDSGTGPITGEALEARVQGIASLDAERVTARHRNEMGVNHPHTASLSSTFHETWEPSIGEVKSFGLRPTTHDEQMLPEHMRRMLEIEADGAIGGGVGPIAPGHGTIGQAAARLGQASTRCTYEYYALGWYSLLLEPDGALVDLAVFRSSGSPSVDERVMVAVRGAAPFGVIPAEALSADGLFRGTWEFGFRDYTRSNCKMKPKQGQPYHATVIAYRGAFY